MDYGPGMTIFAQGDRCEDVFYIQTGIVKLSVPSTTGREAVVAILGPGDFFGEGCLAGQAVRVTTATATTPTATVLVPQQQMAQLLHRHQTVSDRFISHLLARSIRLEEDLINQLASEKRLACTLDFLGQIVLGTRGTV